MQTGERIGRPPAPEGAQGEPTHATRATLLAQGFTAIPNALLHHQAQIDLAASELAILLQIWSYWWDEAVLPYPSVGTLAAAMGSGERQVRQLLTGMARRGLIRIHPRRAANGAQLSNAYDLGPLLARVQGLIEHPDAGQAPPLLDVTPVREPAPAPLRAGAPTPLQPPAGEQDPAGTMTQSEQDRTNGGPEARQDVAAPEPRPSALGTPSPSAARPPGDAAEQRLIDLSRRHGDRAPHVSIAWLRRIRRCGIPDAELLPLLEEAAACVSPHVKRPMPYLLTALEGMVAEWERRDRPPAHRRVAAIRSATAPQGERDTDAVGEAGAPAALWHRIRAELLPAVAPSWQRLLQRTTQDADDGAMLTLRAADATDVQLLKRLLGRIEAEASGCGAPRRLHITIGRPGSEQEGADRPGTRPPAHLLAAG